jgi:hypothetical protein
MKMNYYLVTGSSALFCILYILNSEVGTKTSKTVNCYG